MLRTKIHKFFTNGFVAAAILLIALTIFSFLCSFGVGYGPIARRSWWVAFDRGHVVIDRISEYWIVGWSSSVRPAGEALRFVKEAESIPEVPYTRYRIMPRFLYQSDGISLKLSVPIWPAAILMGGVAAWLYVHNRRRDLMQVGHCPKCSCDLHGQAPSDKCPQCGTPIPAPSAEISPEKTES